nr:MAG TPA: hypothetical protein [Caudoviricetes sp.]
MRNPYECLKIKRSCGFLVFSVSQILTNTN